MKGDADSKDIIERRSQKECPDPEGTSVEETGL